MLQLGVAIENDLVGSLRYGVFEFAQLFLNAAQELGGAQSFLDDGGAFVEIGDLFEVANLQVRLSNHVPGVDVAGTVEDLQERGLPRTIGADETNFFAGIYLEGNVSKYGLSTEGL